ncbi:hypothetical protein C8Q75DRAFT_727273 [Abortiporus biennis]|nr:hypothetical protein C8Q75DRAFT_727273 [Abortiporus biennis]
MTGFFDKIKEKTTGHHHRKSTSPKPKQQQQQQQQPASGLGDDGHPTMSIQPHPAMTNDPKDLEPPQPGGGLNSNPEIGAFHARDPYVPSKEILDNLPPAESNEALKARSAELNKPQ